MDNMARNIETVRRLCADWNSMTQADFDWILAAGCEFRNIPLKGDLTIGPAAIGQSLLALAQRWAVAVDIENVVGDETTVMIERTEHFSHRAARKDPFDLPVVGVFQLADGKITHWKDYADADLATAPLRDCLSNFNGYGRAEPGALTYLWRQRSRPAAGLGARDPQALRLHTSAKPLRPVRSASGC